MSVCICRFCRGPALCPGFWIWSVVAVCFTFKGSVYVSLFEEVGYLSDFGNVISEGGPFIVVVVVGCVHLGLRCICALNTAM